MPRRSKRLTGKGWGDTLIHDKMPGVGDRQIHDTFSGP